ncbi:family 16 glycosylhydrolase [Caldicoprobacter algeriensis]|uniref:family 16 glycosylhydrolase n=1 Tax=Caldicoprobacter algeriensis TaxID=699281 RepID=UPI00207A0DA0|nr:family 16 glycosylhydrolase [Caldicoprobacter algeriensis]MCM8901468.1 family 16 glycosylhydrolase [Caldicoprobacter algeriensis]
MKNKACVSLLLTFAFLIASLFLKGNTYADQLNLDTQQNLILNGGFEEGLEGWKIHNQGVYESWAGLADFSVENGELKVEIKQVGWAWWHIQLYQEPIEVAAGTYKISFDMRSDIKRTVYVELVNSGTEILEFVVDNAMKTYEAIIEVPSDGSYKFMFGLGREPDEEIFNTPYNIFIDNVRFEIYDETGDDPMEPGNPEQPIQKGDWTLVWSDEFDGTGENLNENGVDLNKWDFQEGTGEQYGLIGWGNNEQQYYRKENVFVEDGKLIIEARKESFGGMNYTSGRLYTAKTFTKKYGRFEARIKLPAGQGFWPAFWLMPAKSVYGGWAASGEIDIMEARGRIPNEVWGTIHYGGSWPNNTNNGGKYVFPEGQDITDFHEYAIEWEPGEIRWYVDGELYLTLNNWYSQGENQAAKYSFPAPFDQEFYIILNLAIGGNFDGGRVPPDDLFPARMEVDVTAGV